MIELPNGDVIADVDECIVFIHDWANGISEEDYELL